LTAIDSDRDGRRVTFARPEGAESIRARFVFGADGTHSKSRSLARIRTERDAMHHWFAGVLIDGFGGDQNAAHSSLVTGGRFFILPQGGGRARAYLALMPSRVAPIQADRTGRALLELIAEHLPDGMVSRATVAGPQGIFSNADLWPETRIANGFVLLGDAAGTNDPSIGHGISLAFRDVRELRDAIREYGLGHAALARYATRRAQYYGTLRSYARWMGRLWLEEGPEAEERRTRFRTARDSDPDAGGFNSITILGPRDLVADDSARARFFGETVAVTARPD
jgi:2-polyprenyl-6-methoxyphenol hydroxylase-like FAD-dependent oxidoreductase